MRDQDGGLKLQKSTRTDASASQDEYLNMSIVYCLAATHTSTPGALLRTAIQSVLIYDGRRGDSVRIQSVPMSVGNGVPAA